METHLRYGRSLQSENMLVPEGLETNCQRVLDMTVPCSPSITHCAGPTKDRGFPGKDDVGYKPIEYNIIVPSSGLTKKIEIFLSSLVVNTHDSWPVA